MRKRLLILGVVLALLPSVGLSASKLYIVEVTPTQPAGDVQATVCKESKHCFLRLYPSAPGSKAMIADIQIIPRDGEAHLRIIMDSHYLSLNGIAYHPIPLDDDKNSVKDIVTVMEPLPYSRAGGMHNDLVLRRTNKVLAELSIRIIISQ